MHIIPSMLVHLLDVRCNFLSLYLTPTKCFSMPALTCITKVKPAFWNQPLKTSLHLHVSALPVALTKDCTAHCWKGSAEVPSQTWLCEGAECMKCLNELCPSAPLTFSSPFAHSSLTYLLVSIASVLIGWTSVAVWKHLLQLVLTHDTAMYGMYLGSSPFSPSTWCF